MPVGIVALIVTSVVLPSALAGVAHVIDYAGTALLAGAAGALVLLVPLAGMTCAWGSWQILGLCGVAAVMIVAFIAVERRAAEPGLPLSLFCNSIFVSTSALVSGGVWDVWRYHISSSIHAGGARGQPHRLGAGPSWRACCRRRLCQGSSSRSGAGTKPFPYLAPR